MIVPTDQGRLDREQVNRTSEKAKFKKQQQKPEEEEEEEENKQTNHPHHKNERAIIITCRGARRIEAEREDCRVHVTTSSFCMGEDEALDSWKENVLQWYECRCDCGCGYKVNSSQKKEAVPRGDGVSIRDIIVTPRDNCNNECLFAMLKPILPSRTMKGSILSARRGVSFVSKKLGLEYSGQEDDLKYRDTTAHTKGVLAEYFVADNFLIHQIPLCTGQQHKKKRTYQQPWAV
eukprot:scaffold35724_cov160-Amphora_coffeaeformis.AAC.1